MRSPAVLPQTLLTVLVGELFGLLIRHVSLGLQVGLVSDQNDDLETSEAAGEPGPSCSPWSLWTGPGLPGQGQEVDSVCGSPHRGRRTEACVCVGVSTHRVGIGQISGVRQPAAEVIVGAPPAQSKVTKTSTRHVDSSPHQYLVMS